MVVHRGEKDSNVTVKYKLNSFAHAAGISMGSVSQPAALVLAKREIRFTVIKHDGISSCGAVPVTAT